MEDEFKVPEAYQNEGWTKDIKTTADVWTKLAGTEKLIGQKSEGKIDLLTENSSPEEIKTFYKTLGRPDEAKGYEFNREGQSEQLKKFNSDEMDMAIKEIFHKHDLTSKQATGIQKDYEALLELQITQQRDTQKKSDDDFEEAATKAFGHDKDAIMESSKVILEKFAPEGFDEHIKNLDNDSLTIMAGVVNNLKTAYISEDEFKTFSTGTKSASDGSEDELRVQAKTLMASEEWTDPFNKRNAQVKEEVSEIYRKIGEME